MVVGNRKDFWSGILFALLGVFFIVFAQEHELGQASRMGPAYFPTVLGILLIAIGLIVALLGYFRKAPVTENGEDTGEIMPIRWNVLFLILGSILVFGLALNTFGLMLSLAAMILIAGLASPDFRFKETLAIILVMDLLAWLIFVYGVGMLVPVWPVFM